MIGMMNKYVALKYFKLAAEPVAELAAVAAAGSCHTHFLQEMHILFDYIDYSPS